jgi:integrase
MRYRDIDYENKVWVAPAEDMKQRKADKAKRDGEHLVPLSDWAVEMLEELRAYNEGDYVFPSSRNLHVRMTTDDLLYGLYVLGYRGITTSHGFRAVASTVLNEHREQRLHKFGEEVIEKQLAHKEPNKVKSAYNRAKYLGPRVELMDYWSAFVKGLLAGSPTPQNVSR